MSKNEYQAARPNFLSRGDGPLVSLLNFAHRAWCSVSAGFDTSPNANANSSLGQQSVQASANDPTWERHNQ